MTPAAWLIVLAAIAHLLPDVLTYTVGGTRSAWDYCMQGVQAAALWFLVADLHLSIVIRAISWWGVFESIQRPVCRVMLPMDKPPQIPSGQNMCSVATGLSTEWLGLITALFVVALCQESKNG